MPAGYGYDAVKIVADAMLRAGRADRAAIAAALPTTNTYGLTGIIAFDERGDLKGGAVTLHGVRDGVIQRLLPPR